MEGVVKMDNNYLVDIQHERLSFFTPAGEVKALNDVSIHLKEGEVLGIVGESGSGKSVTAYSLMGLTAYPGKLIGGELHFNGHEVEKMTEKDFSKMRGKEVSIIFQDPLTSLNPVYTIGNQIMEVIRLHTDADKKKAYARAVELLSLVGINEPEKRMKQYPHELSGGMRQRVMIAIALACEPKLLIADEPTTALDVTIQAQILELMMELKDKLGMAIIMITLTWVSWRACVTVLQSCMPAVSWRPVPVTRSSTIRSMNIPRAFWRVSPVWTARSMRS